jgi:hypothetical protein
MFRTCCTAIRAPLNSLPVLWQMARPRTVRMMNCWKSLPIASVWCSSFVGGARTPTHVRASERQSSVRAEERMTTSSQVVNYNGELWTVSHNESTLLTTIGGYLLTVGDIGLITISTHLSPDEQACGRNALLRRLVETPIGTVHTAYWSPDDKKRFLPEPIRLRQ